MIMSEEKKHGIRASEIFEDKIGELEDLLGEENIFAVEEDIIRLFSYSFEYVLFFLSHIYYVLNPDENVHLYTWEMKKRKGKIFSFLSKKVTLGKRAINRIREYRNLFAHKGWRLSNAVESAKNRGLITDYSSLDDAVRFILNELLSYLRAVSEFSSDYIFYDDCVEEVSSGKCYDLRGLFFLDIDVLNGPQIFVFNEAVSKDKCEYMFFDEMKSIKCQDESVSLVNVVPVETIKSQYYFDEDIKINLERRDTNNKYKVRISYINEERNVEVKLVERVWKQKEKSFEEVFRPINYLEDVESNSAMLKLVVLNHKDEYVYNKVFYALKNVKGKLNIDENNSPRIVGMPVEGAEIKVKIRAEYTGTVKETFECSVKEYSDIFEYYPNSRKIYVDPNAPNVDLVFYVRIGRKTPGKDYYSLGRLVVRNEGEDKITKTDLGEIFIEKSFEPLSFIDRKTIKSNIEDMLKKIDFPVRCVLIHGQAGSGKTRLKREIIKMAQKERYSIIDEDLKVNRGKDFLVDMLNQLGRKKFNILTIDNISTYFLDFLMRSSRSKILINIDNAHVHNGYLYKFLEALRNFLDTIKSGKYRITVNNKKIMFVFYARYTGLGSDEVDSNIISKLKGICDKSYELRPEFEDIDESENKDEDKDKAVRRIIEKIIYDIFPNIISEE